MIRDHERQSRPYGFVSPINRQKLGMLLRLLGLLLGLLGMMLGLLLGMMLGLLGMLLGLLLGLLLKNKCNLKYWNMGLVYLNK